MEAIIAPTDRARTLAAFTSRDFRLLWGGQTVSFVGDAAFLVAIGWRVTTMTGSAGALGFVLALQSAAMLTTLLWGGVLADRHSRRLLMIGSDLARFGLVAVLALVEGTGHLSYTWVLVLATLVGFADGFFHPAFGGAPGMQCARRRTTAPCRLLRSRHVHTEVSCRASFVGGHDCPRRRAADRGFAR